VFKSASHIHYNDQHGTLTFGTGAHAVHFATLAPHLHLTQADFLLV